MDFNNTEVAFTGKTDADLNRSYWLFKIIGWNWLIKLSPTLLKLFMPLYFPIPIIRATIFKQFCGGENIEDCNTTIDELGKYNVKTILDYSVEGIEEENTFDANLIEIISSVKKAANTAHIPFSVFKVTGFARFGLLEKVNEGTSLSKEETDEFERAKTRINKICEVGFKLNSPIFIDAEESWIQDAIDEIALDMMRKYNKEKAIIFNTAQLYRWDRLEYLKKLKQTADKEHFFIGMKIVRGAYIEKERDRAEKYGYPDPMQQTKANTDKDYDLAIQFCIENIHQFSFCCASHNEDSTQFLLQLMEQHKIDKSDERIYFAQLLGMSDHISMNMAQKNYNVAKYVPYGPVKEVTPYLIRRAEENTSIAGQTGRELSLIVSEKQRRKK